MLDTLKKTLYAGIGVAFLTKDRVEELARKLAEDAKLSQGEGKKLVDEFLRKSEESRQSVESMVASTTNAALEKALDRLDIPRRNEIRALEARIRALEAGERT